MACCWLKIRGPCYVTIATAFLILILPSVSPGQNLRPPSQVDILFNQARFDMMNGNYEKALQELEKARKLDPQDKRLGIWQVRFLRSLGREEEALSLCQQLLKSEPVAFSQLHFEAAQVLFGEGQSQQAMQHLQAAERYYPEEALRAQIDLLIQCEQYDKCEAITQKALKSAVINKEKALITQAKIHFKNYQYDQAMQCVQMAKQASTTKNATKEIEALENDIKIVNRPWWLGFNLAYLYDNNVFLDPIYEDPAHALASGQSSSAAMGEAWMGYRLARYQGFDFGVTGHLMYMDYFDQSEASYSYWSPGMYVSWGKYRWGFRLPYNFYYYYHTGSMTGWSRIHSLTPSVYWQMTSNLKTYFTGVILQRQYFDERSNAMHYGLVIDHVYTFGMAGNFLKLSYRFDDEDADDDISGYRGLEVTIAGGWKIWRQLGFEAGITYAHYDYDQRPEWTLAYKDFERKDDQWRYYLELSWQFHQWWNLKINCYYMDNDSNVESSVSPYDYNKYVIMLVLTKYF